MKHGIIEEQPDILNVDELRQRQELARYHMRRAGMIESYTLEPIRLTPLIESVTDRRISDLRWLAAGLLLAFIGLAILGAVI